MKYLIDTNTLIDYSKKRRSIISNIISLVEDEHELGVCAINITEFYSGIPTNEHIFWDDFFNSLYYWNITPRAAKKAGLYRYNFARKGITLSTADAMIAAVAWAHHATILTDNVKDFPMDDIPVKSLRDQ